MKPLLFATVCTLCLLNITIFVTPEGECVRIETDESVRAPARGQSAVIYCGERVLGGGYIV